MIIKRKRTASFAIIPNTIANDFSISLEARGILIYLLSKPDNWEVQIHDIRRAGCDMGRNKAYDVIKELKDAKYIIQEQKHSRSGRFNGAHYEVYDAPQFSENIDEPCTGIRDAVEPCPQSPHPVLPHPVKGDTVYIDKQKQNSNKTDSLQNTQAREGGADALEREDLENDQVSAPIGSSPRAGSSETSQANDIKNPDAQNPAQHPSKDKSNRLFQKCLKKWPVVGDSIENAQHEWLALPWSICQLVDDRLIEFIEARRKAGRKQFCAFSTFLRERQIEQLPDKVDAPADNQTVLKRFGPVWCVVRMQSLANAKRAEWHPNKVQQAMVEAGKGHLWNEQRWRAEFPYVATLDKVQMRIEPDRVPPKATLERCRWVALGSDEWALWRDYHSDNDWPFIGDPKAIGLEGAWFPALMPHSSVAGQDLATSQIASPRMDDALDGAAERKGQV